MSSTSPVQAYTEHLAAVKAIAWSPHQHGLLASGGGTADQCIRFWNTLTGQPLQCLNTGSQVCNLAWSKHSNELVSTELISFHYKCYIACFRFLLLDTPVLYNSFYVVLVDYLAGRINCVFKFAFSRCLSDR